jgi:hypothetical protein
MSGLFSEKLDAWLKEQDDFSTSLARFKNIGASYFKGAEHTPAELKEKLDSLEKTVGDLKSEFVGVLELYYELHKAAYALLMDEKLAAQKESVLKVRPPAQHKPSPAAASAEAAAPKAAVEAEEGFVLPPDKPTYGILGYLNYAEWFYKQSEPDQKKISTMFLDDPRFKPKDLLEREITFLPPKMASYLYQTANKLMAANFDDIATALLIKGLTIVADKTDKEMIHTLYAKYFYNKRKELKDAYTACISHCEKAVKSYLSDDEPRNKPIAPFKLLTKICEEQGDFKKILDIADKAIKLYENSPSPDRADGFRKIKEVLVERGIK